MYISILFVHRSQANCSWLPESMLSHLWHISASEWLGGSSEQWARAPGKGEQIRWHSRQFNKERAYCISNDNKYNSDNANPQEDIKRIREA